MQVLWWYVGFVQIVMGTPNIMEWEKRRGTSSPISRRETISCPVTKDERSKCGCLMSPSTEVDLFVHDGLTLPEGDCDHVSSNFVNDWHNIDLRRPRFMRSITQHVAIVKSLKTWSMVDGLGSSSSDESSLIFKDTNVSHFFRNVEVLRQSTDLNFTLWFLTTVNIYDNDQGPINIFLEHICIYQNVVEARLKTSIGDACRNTFWLPSKKYLTADLFYTEAILASLIVPTMKLGNQIFSAAYAAEFVLPYWRNPQALHRWNMERLQVIKAIGRHVTPGLTSYIHLVMLSKCMELGLPYDPSMPEIRDGFLNMRNFLTEILSLDWDLIESTFPCYKYRTGSASHRFIAPSFLKLYPARQAILVGSQWGFDTFKIAKHYILANFDLKGDGSLIPGEVPHFPYVPIVKQDYGENSHCKRLIDQYPFLHHKFPHKFGISEVTVEITAQKVMESMAATYPDLKSNIGNDGLPVVGVFELMYACDHDYPNYITIIHNKIET